MLERFRFSSGPHRLCTGPQLTWQCALQYHRCLHAAHLLKDCTPTPSTARQLLLSHLRPNAAVSESSVIEDPNLATPASSPIFCCCCFLASRSPSSLSASIMSSWWQKKLGVARSQLHAVIWRSLIRLNYCWRAFGYYLNVQFERGWQRNKRFTNKHACDLGP